MDVSSVFGHTTQPVFAFCKARPAKYTEHTIPFALPPQTSIKCSTGIKQSGEFQRVPTTGIKYHSKSLSISKMRQSAMVDIQNSSELATALLRSGDVLKAQDLNVVLRHFGQLHRWKDLSQLFDWMRQRGKTNIASYSSYIKFIGTNFNSTKALEIYNSITDEPTRNHVSICNSTLNCLIRSGKFEDALKLFNRMKQAGLVPDIVTYSTMLGGCVKVKDGYFKAVELVQEIKSRGLHMDAVVYGTLLSVCASNKKCKEAELYFDEMKSEGHNPNIFHYSSLLNAYAVDGNYKKADGLIQEMKTSGFVLNKVSLTTLLKVYVKGGLFEKSAELLNELEALGYAEDEMPYCLLIDGLAKSGKLTEAKSIFDKMRNKEVKNDGYSYSIMITALCRNDLIEEAKKLACEFEAKYDKYDVVILNSMLSAYCRSGEMENVMKTMKKMDDSSISPDWNTFHILIKYFCKEKLYVLAYRTMEDMHKKGHQPEEDLCVTLIRRLGKMGAHSEAFSVYNMLKYGKRIINKTLHEKILYILLSGGLLKDAYLVVKDHATSISQPAIKKFAISFINKGNINLVNDVIKSIHGSGYKIDQDLFRMGISRYIEQPEKKELLFHLLQWMPGQGYVLDLSTKTLILKNSDLFGRHFISELLSKQYVVLKTNKSRDEGTK